MQKHLSGDLNADQRAQQQPARQTAVNGTPLTPGGYAADGKRIRKKVSGQTRTEVKGKLKTLHSELDAGRPDRPGLHSRGRVANWLAEGLLLLAESVGEAGDPRAGRAIKSANVPVWPR